MLVLIWVVGFLIGMVWLSSQVLSFLMCVPIRMFALWVRVGSPCVNANLEGSLVLILYSWNVS